MNTFDESIMVIFATYWAPRRGMCLSKKIMETLHSTVNPHITSRYKYVM